MDFPLTPVVSRKVVERAALCLHHASGFLLLFHQPAPSSTTPGLGTWRTQDGVFPTQVIFLSHFLWAQDLSLSSQRCSNMQWPITPSVRCFPNFFYFPVFWKQWTKALAFFKTLQHLTKGWNPGGKGDQLWTDPTVWENLILLLCSIGQQISIYKCIENKIQICNSDYIGTEIGAFCICGYVAKLNGKIIQCITANVLDCYKYKPDINQFLMWIYILGFPSAFQVLK